MNEAISVASEARRIANWDVHEAKRTLFARLVWALEDVDAFAQVNAMNVSDYMEMRANRDEARAVIERVRAWYREGHYLAQWIPGAAPTTFDRGVGAAAHDVFAIIDGPPSSALDEVKAEAWDEGVDAGFDNAGLPTPQWAQNPYRKEVDDDSR